MQARPSSFGSFHAEVVLLPAGGLALGERSWRVLRVFPEGKSEAYDGGSAQGDALDAGETRRTRRGTRVDYPEGFRVARLPGRAVSKGVPQNGDDRRGQPAWARSEGAC